MNDPRTDSKALAVAPDVGQEDRPLCSMSYYRHPRTGGAQGVDGGTRNLVKA